jgi:LmbE family N-acetylglucosaminyl deacetylase
MVERILVVAAHPDDEALGMGGTIARLAAEGAEVMVAFMTCGAYSEADMIWRPDSTLTGSLPAPAPWTAPRTLGATATRWSGILVDNALDGGLRLHLAQKVEGWIGEWAPAAVYTHSPADCNIDHRLTFEAVLAATRPKPGCPVKAVFSFEVPSATEWAFGTFGDFGGNLFVALPSAALTAKVKALECYGDQTSPWPHPRSETGVRVLAAWRGATVGVEAAEAFELVRWVR